MSSKKATQGKPVTENRRVIKFGGSFYLNLFPESVITNRIKPGDRVPITCDHLLKAIPLQSGKRVDEVKVRKTNHK